MNKTRVGLIEVGSRSVRYLVMDVRDRFQESEAIKITTVQHGVDPTSVRSSDIEVIGRVISDMRADLSEHSCDIEYVYGTELCRSIEKNKAGKLPPFVSVLSPEKEALAAWAAAFLCQSPEDHGQRLTVVDLGNGSTQVVRGMWGRTTIKELRAASVPIGSSVLVARYHKDKPSFLRYLKEESSSVKDALSRAELDLDRTGVVYLVGGVATKIGWLTVRKDVADVYRPDRVNGASIGLSDLDEVFSRLHSAYNRSPRAVERLVDGRPDHEGEAVRVISGAAYFGMLIRAVHSTTAARISGYGVRHGIAFLLRHRLLET